MTDPRVLYLIGTAAPPVRQLDEACRIAIDLDWDPCVILSPTAADWVDLDRLAEITAKPVRVHPRRPDEPDPLPPADAVLAAPLTFNTINKWAAGISDTVALGILNELLVGGPPIVAVPWVKPTLRSHPAYEVNSRFLREAGVVFVDEDDIKSRGPEQVATFVWQVVLRAVGSPPLTAD